MTTDNDWERIGASIDAAVEERSPDWTAAHGAITAYPDIPAEMLTGLARGELSHYLQEVHDAGWFVHISPAIGGNRANVKIWRAYDHYYGRDDDTHRVDIMIARAYIAWKGREG